MSACRHGVDSHYGSFAKNAFWSGALEHASALPASTHSFGAKVVVDFQVVCVCRSRTGATSHGHIYTVGIGKSGRYIDLLWVEEVYESILAGNRFYTVNLSTGRPLLLYPDVCCGLPTLRCVGEDVADANVDDLPSCDSLDIAP
jgi:hypothetical protein